MHRVVLWFQDVAVPFLGPPGVFLAAMLDSSFLSLPEINDLLVVTAAARGPETAWLFAAMATLGSLAGCSLLWSLARRRGEPFLERRFGAARVLRTRRAFQRYDLLALAIPALLPPPMPFKIFVLCSGVFGISYRRFALTLLAARGMRYLAWALVGLHFGEEAVSVLKHVDAWFAQRLPLVLALAGTAMVLWLATRRVLQRTREAA
jgi:membrane protein YqaA with SNARE-associated domain